jgi:hypothetical protein
MADPIPDPGVPAEFAGPRPERSGVPVLAAGAVTTALSLAAVVALEGTVSPMGWYADYVIPIGAMLVGLFASSGFALASWLTGTKISGRLLAATLLVLFTGYAAVQWFEYQRLFVHRLGEGGAQVSFFAWFDWVTRTIAFEGKHGEPGEPLGLLGYGVRVLEVAGFCGGGALIPFVLRKQPYCDTCGLYMRSRELGLMPAGLVPKLFGNKSPEREEQRQALVAAARAGSQAIFAAAAKDGTSLRDALSVHAPPSGKKAAGKVESRILFTLASCRRCRRGKLDAVTITGQGRQIRRTPSGSAEVTADVVDGLGQAS